MNVHRRPTRSLWSPGWKGRCRAWSAGLVDCPVIAVPTSIGYASFLGLVALLGMLNSCASNVVVVNIDAGFKGGHVAGLIAGRAGQAREKGRNFQGVRADLQRRRSWP